MRHGLNSKSGFSLVELMVVIAIISILSMIAIPKFRTFQAKARRAEAFMNLENLYNLEEAYHAENDTYIQFNIHYDEMCVGGSGVGGTGPGSHSVANALGFYLTDCTKARYAYTTATATTFWFEGVAYSGVGAGNLVVPGCNYVDTIHIDQDKIIGFYMDAIAACP